MVLTLTRLINLLKKFEDEGHGDCLVESRNQAGNLEFVCRENVLIKSNDSGVFILKIDPAVDKVSDDR